MDIKNLTQTFTQFSAKIQEGVEKIQSLLQELQEEAQKGNQKAQQWSQKLQDISDSFQAGRDKINNTFEQMGSFFGKDTHQSEGDEKHSGTGLADIVGKIFKK